MGGNASKGEIKIIMACKKTTKKPTKKGGCGKKGCK